MIELMLVQLFCHCSISFAMFQIATTEQNNQFPVSRNIDENHLTARSAIDDVVEGFELGANDYLKKPFGMMELIVRLRSLAGRRQVQTAPAPQTYRIGEFTFHPDTLRLDHAGTSEELSPREAKIFELLCASKGETLYTRPLLLEIWGDDDFFNSRSLQVFISKLRRRLEPDPRIRIVNVRGEGYKLLVNE